MIPKEISCYILASIGDNRFRLGYYALDTSEAEKACSAGVRVMKAKSAVLYPGENIETGAIVAFAPRENFPESALSNQTPSRVHIQVDYGKTMFEETQA